MKILILTDRLALGGAETHIYELIHGLLARGAAVEIASAGGAYAQRLMREGVKHVQINWATHNPLALARAKRQLEALLSQGGYTLVHAHARLPAYLAAKICRRLHIPLVTTAHWVFRADGWRGHMSRWGDHTLAVSEDIRHYLIIEYHLSPQDITVTKNGINTARFAPATGGGHGRLIHVSRLDEGRAAAATALIALAPELMARGAASLTIVGDGKCFAPLCREAERINRALGKPFIRMLGAQTDIAPLLREGDVFIGVSRAALEAMACGLAVVLAGDEGYLSIFSPTAAKAAECSNFCCRGEEKLTKERLLGDLTALLSDEPLCRQLGTYGRDYVCRHYSAEAMVEDAFRVYRSLAEKKLRPPMIICGYYGFHNMGDEAVLGDLLLRLRREGFGRITVLSARPGETSEHHHVAAEPRFSLSAIRRVGAERGIFLLGGGNLLQNETSRRSLLYYTQAIRFAKRCGCRILVLGGIGRLDTGGESIVSRILPLVDGFLGRTPQDVAYAQQLSPALRTHLLPDGALWTPPATALPSNLPKENVLLVALHGQTPACIAKPLVDACAAIARHEGLHLAFSCMHEGQDQALAQAGCMRVPTAQILPRLSAEETVAFLTNRCRLVITTRLHMLIFAAVAGVPTITVEDGGKISAFVAYAESCAAQETPIACLQDEQYSTPLPHIRHMLAAPHSKEQGRRLLSSMRAPGEHFSFLSFFHASE